MHTRTLDTPHVPPQVLLLDEPFGALDPTVRASLREGLRAIVKRLGVTTIIVTHDQVGVVWGVRACASCCQISANLEWPALQTTQSRRPDTWRWHRTT